MPEFKALIEGYKRFRADAYREQKARYDELASDGQSPPVMVISCCDSRVDPATIFDTVPGQVFALRNVANLVPPLKQAAACTARPLPSNLACWDWASNILL